MVSRRKLEEEIARSKDPVIRKQLKELLDKRNHKWEKDKKKAVQFTGGQIEGLLAGAAVGMVVGAGIIIVLLIVLLILWLIGVL